MLGHAFRWVNIDEAQKQAALPERLVEGEDKRYLRLVKRTFAKLLVVKPFAEATLDTTVIGLVA